MPAYVMEVRRCFKEAYTEACLQTNCEAGKQKCYYDRVTSTVQLVPGNVVLMKNDAYQGKQKVKDRWSKTEYVVVHQVADGIPAYEVKDEVGNIKTVHCNWLFLVATLKEVATFGSRHMKFRGKRLVHPCRTYLIRGRERFSREISGWG